MESPQIATSIKHKNLLDHCLGQYIGRASEIIPTLATRGCWIRFCRLWMVHEQINYTDLNHNPIQLSDMKLFAITLIFIGINNL